MKQQILKHIKIVNDMKAAHLPYSFISEFGAEKCWQISTMILENGISDITEQMSKDAIKYFMTDPGVIPYLKQMSASILASPIIRLNYLLIYAEEKLSEFECQDIQEVFENDEISIYIQYYFLKYFKNLELSEEEYKQVLAGLVKYNEKVDLDITQLTAEERMILTDPLFTTNLLEKLWNVRETWSVLLRPEVRLLLHTISETTFGNQYLYGSQFRQIAESPKEIQSLLEMVLSCFTDEQRARFMERWLENDTLLPDLKRLIKVLPDMEESQKEKILYSKVTYVRSVYNVKMDKIDMEALNDKQSDILIYAIITGKKHFLTLVNENDKDFLAVQKNSILLDQDIYRKYLNLNTLNERNLRDSYSLKMVHAMGKSYLNRKTYTFEELKVLAPLKPHYYQLYGLLTNPRSDERLRVLKELVKRDCVPCMDDREEEVMKRLAQRLSEKPLSMWMQRELGHIKDLSASASVELLADWEVYQRFIPGLVNGKQVNYLIQNKDVLSKYGTLEEFQENMLWEDKTWLKLKEKLSITDEFVEQYENRVRQFVYDGEAEIVHQFCMETENKWEIVRRLVTAELMGEFERLKYHEEDLEREIDYPVSAEVEETWKDNLSRSMEECRIWEEDRFIPVLQVGEIPMHTCISYQNGINKECLLSCFDANKKVIYFEKNGKIVYRALIRLTKGSVSAKPIRTKCVEFVDLTKEKGKTDQGIEELILFLERPYFGGISEEQENAVVSWVYQMVHEKAKRLHARVVISKSYEKYEASKQYGLMDYYVYISASKNGRQYLDSLGGEATVSQSGTYGKNKFLMLDTEKEENVA